MSNNQASIASIKSRFTFLHGDVRSYKENSMFPPVELTLSGSIPTKGALFYNEECFRHYLKLTGYGCGLPMESSLFEKRSGAGWSCVNITPVDSNNTRKCSAGYCRLGKNPFFDPTCNWAERENQPYVLLSSLDCMCASKLGRIPFLRFSARSMLKYETPEECAYAVANYLLDLTKQIPLGVQYFDFKTKEVNNELTVYVSSHV